MRHFRTKMNDITVHCLLTSTRFRHVATNDCRKLTVRIVGCPRNVHTEFLENRSASLSIEGGWLSLVNWRICKFFLACSHKSLAASVSVLMSVRLSHGLYQHGFSGNLVRGTIVCRETLDLVKIRLHYRAVYFGQQYEVVCSWAAVQLDRIVAFPWHHSTVLCCWQLHVGQQQYKGNVLLRFLGNIQQFCIVDSCM